MSRLRNEARASARLELRAIGKPSRAIARTLLFHKRRTSRTSHLYFRPVS